MPIAYLCDFDGTVSPRDIGAEFAERFSAGGEAARVAELTDWSAGRIGHRELTRAQCARIRANEADATAFARGFALDPRFAPFARATLGRGDAVMIVSEGFDFYVREHLERAGLAELPWAANQLVFHANGSVEPAFPFADPSCEACGNCKAQHVRRYQSRGFRTVLVGDGASDRHGALAADAVLARGSLARWCRAEGVPHREFQDFGDVAEFARQQESLAPRSARGGKWS